MLSLAPKPVPASAFRDLQEENARLKREVAQLEGHVTSLQRRGTELLDEARANRRIANAPPGELVALSHVSHERRRQDLLHGKPDSPERARIKDGTGGHQMVSRRDYLQGVVGACEKAGSVTFAMLLAEEVAEVIAETEPKRIRQELTEVAALAVLWIEMLDRRANINPLPATGGIPLPGWTCTAVSCGVFNGAGKEWLATCRSCSSPAPERPQ